MDNDPTSISLNSFEIAGPRCFSNTEPLTGRCEKSLDIVIKYHTFRLSDQHQH